MSSDYRSFDDLPLTLRVEELMPILGIGRNTAYELVRSGKIRGIRGENRSASLRRRCSGSCAGKVRDRLQIGP